MRLQLSILTTCVISVLFVLESNADSYLCISEASGGVALNNGKWIGTSFRVNDEKYIITSKDNRNYSIKLIGDNSNLFTCERASTGGELSTRIICGGLGYGAIFDFTTNRFQYYYSFGFIEGQDDGKNTPSITVAKCSEIEVN